MQELFVQILSSAIVAFGSWALGYTLVRLHIRNPAKTAAPGQYAPTSQAMQAMQPVYQTPVGGLNAGQVLIHVGILQFVINVVGFILGLFIGVWGAVASMTATQLAAVELLILFVVGTITSIIGFGISAMRVERAIRWQHLTLVGAGTALLTLVVNSLALQSAVTLEAIIVALIQTSLAAFIGGWLANLFSPRGRTAQPLQPLQPPQPALPSQPLPPPPQGVWPNAPQQYPPATPYYPPQPPIPSQPPYPNGGPR